jgi:WD40 repeat protein
VSTLVNLAPPPSPYKGLAPFEDSELDAFLFFGRSWETEVVSANVLASRLTVLYGPSGVGKSSLLRAGVVRALRAEPGFPRPAVAYYGSWGGDALAGLLEASHGAVAEALGHEPAEAPGGLADQLAAWSAELGAELCLLLDQLEELFLYHPGEGAGGFVELLPELVGRPGLRVNVLLGIRDDALSQLDVFKSRIPSLFGNSLRLDHLDREAGRAAILGPLECYAALAEEEVAVEPELVESVLDEVATGRIEPGLAGRGSPPDAEEAGSRIETPYLQLVLQRIWEVERERGSSLLRLETFRGLGGAERIVQDHLERALQALSPTEQDAAANVFGHLVTPSGTKIAHAVGDLASYAEVGERELEPVLRSLAGQRILRPLGENGHAGGRYEIFHDVLADAVLAWRTRHDADTALAREREAARRRQRQLAWLVVAALIGLALMTALAAYAFTQRSEAREQAAAAREQKATAEDSARAAQSSARAARKARAKAVDLAQDARKQKKLADDARDDANAEAENARAALSTAREAEDLARKLAVRESEHARVAIEAKAQADVLRTRAQSLLVSAKNARDRAEKAKDSADKARNRAQAQRFVALSLAKLSTDPEQSVRHALRASELSKSKAVGAEDTLRKALVAMHVEHVFPKAGPRAVARFSGDGRRLVTGGGSRQVRVYARGGELLREFRSGSEVNDVALNRDGSLVAAADRDGHVRIWSVDSRALVRDLEHGEPVAAVAWSPAEDLLATAGSGSDASARLWDTGTAMTRLQLSHASGLSRVSFSSDGGRLLTVGEPAVDVFDVATGIRIAALRNPESAMTSAAFGPGGDLVVTGGGLNARIWDVRTGNSLHLLGPHTGRVVDVAFSPNGDHVATASVDSLGRVWNAHTGVIEDVLHDHGGPPVNDIDFSPTAESWAVVTAGGDKTARYWAPGQQSVVLLGHDGAVTGASFSPDGTSILTASGDRSARVWDPLGDRPLRVIERRDRGSVSSVAVNRTGSLIASGGEDRVVRVISPQGRVLRTLPPLPQRIVSVGWSNRGWLLAASRNGVVQVWDGGQQLTAVRHGEQIRAAAISADGTLLATAGAGENGLVRLWRVPSGTPLPSLDDGDPDTGAVTSVAFNPTGKQLASASGPFGYVWQLDTGTFRRLEGHGDTVRGIAFSETGRLLATSSADSTARVWTLKTERWTPFVGHGGTVVDVAFSSDSRWLATAGPRKAGLWQVGKSDLPRNFLFFAAPERRLALTSIAFSPRNWTVVTGNDDGTVRSYSCDYCGRLKQLIPLAKARLATLSAERKR